MVEALHGCGVSWIKVTPLRYLVVSVFMSLVNGYTTVTRLTRYVLAVDISNETMNHIKDEQARETAANGSRE